MSDRAATRSVRERVAVRRDLDELVQSLCAAFAGAPDSAPAHRRCGSLWDAVEPHLASFGVTRVGDLTGLDDIGVPVWFVCRPNSRSLAASQGKGLTHHGARLGAVMESLEQACAERHEDLVIVSGRRRDLTRLGWQCLASRDFLRSEAEPDDDAHVRHWAHCQSLTTGRAYLAPFELVGFDLREDAPWDHAAFRMSTIGLAAGATMAEAALHAALELVERDATAAIDAMGLHPLFARRVDLAPGRDAEIDDAVARVRSAGLDVVFADVTGGQCAPVLAAFIAPAVGGRNTGPERVFAGFACRLAARDAALSALLEAVQSRLTFIAGARDDLTPGDYVMRRARLPRLAGKSVVLHDIAGFEAGLPIGSPSRQLARVIERLMEQGASDVYLAPLGGVDGVFSVVRLLAPGLAATTRTGALRLGASALKPLLAKAGAS